MKQTIIDLLKTKFEGVDESILSRIADTKAAKAVKTEDEANTFVEGVTLNQLLSSYGDIRSTEAQRTAVTNYEKKHGLKDGKKVPFHLGHFFIAIDTDHFLGEDVCRKKAGDIIREVRGARKAPGAERIYSAGEKEYEIRLSRESGVPINESVQGEMSAVRDKLGLTQYVFPWEK